VLSTALHPPGRASGEGDGGARIRHGRAVGTGRSRSALSGQALCDSGRNSGSALCRLETRDSGRDDRTSHRHRGDLDASAVRRAPLADGPARRCALAKVLNGFLFLRGEDFQRGATHDCAPEIADAKLPTSSERFAALCAGRCDPSCVGQGRFSSAPHRLCPVGASGLASSRRHRGANAPPDHRPLPAAATMTSAKVETQCAFELANEPLGPSRHSPRRHVRRPGGHR
jgi:hypothetical protein